MPSVALSTKIAPTNGGHLAFLAVTLFAILISAAPLRALEPKKPVANNQSDFWADLSAGRVTHPQDLFTYPQMKKTIDTMIGGREDTIKKLVYGAGSVAHRGDLFVADSCLPHYCMSNVILFVLDAKNKATFIAWKLKGKPLVVIPSVEQWPPQAQTELDEWSVGWKIDEAH